MTKPSSASVLSSSFAKTAFAFAQLGAQQAVLTLDKAQSPEETKPALLSLASHMSHPRNAGLAEIFFCASWDRVSPPPVSRLVEDSVFGPEALHVASEDFLSFSVRQADRLLIPGVVMAPLTIKEQYAERNLRFALLNGSPVQADRTEILEKWNAAFYAVAERMPAQALKLAHLSLCFDPIVDGAFSEAIVIAAPKAASEDPFAALWSLRVVSFLARSAGAAQRADHADSLHAGILRRDAMEKKPGERLADRARVANLPLVALGL